MSVYHWWQECLKGKQMPIHEGDPQCGYFKMRDRSGENRNKPAIKRPWIPAAIWIDGDGRFQAEINGKHADPINEWIWLAKHPISYEDYLDMKKE